MRTKQTYINKQSFILMHCSKIAMLPVNEIDLANEKIKIHLQNKM